MQDMKSGVSHRQTLATTTLDQAGCRTEDSLVWSDFSMPGDATFFQNGYQSDFGKFFLKWYSDVAWLKRFTVKLR